MQATVCLCGRDTCNGPNLPPKDFFEDEESVIDIDEVVREMNAELDEARPAAPVASAAVGCCTPPRRLLLMPFELTMWLLLLILTAVCTLK